MPEPTEAESTSAYCEYVITEAHQTTDLIIIAYPALVHMYEQDIKPDPDDPEQSPEYVMTKATNNLLSSLTKLSDSQLPANVSLARHFAFRFDFLRRIAQGSSNDLLDTVSPQILAGLLDELLKQDFCPQPPPETLEQFNAIVTSEGYITERFGADYADLLTYRKVFKSAAIDISKPYFDQLFDLRTAKN